MKLGVTLAFDAQNAAGGIRGRQIVLDFRDDQYQPALAEEDARTLVRRASFQGRAALPDDERRDRSPARRPSRRPRSTAGRTR